MKTWIVKEGEIKAEHGTIPTKDLVLSESATKELNDPIAEWYSKKKKRRSKLVEG